MIKNCSICNGTGKIELPNDFSKPCICTKKNLSYEEYKKCTYDVVPRPRKYNISPNIINKKENTTYIPFDEYYKTYVIKRDWLKQNIFNVDNSTY